MRSIGGILPWAVALAVIGGAIWWLLSKDMAAGRWLLAALLIGHGVVHILFAVPAPAATVGGPAWPFGMAGSWLVTGADLGLSMVRMVGLGLVAIVVVGFALAALSTVGIVVPSGWWRPTVAMAALASGVMLVLFFEPQLILGLAIDAALLWVAATGAWAP